MITALKWKDHPILKNLELDFSKSDGTPYNTIILAGENGTGKTTILETIARFLNGGSFAPYDYLRYDIGDERYRLNQNRNLNAEVGLHNRIRERDGHVFANRVNNFKKDKEDIRYYGVAFSKARSGFTTKIVKATTTEQVDAEKSSIDEDDDYTRIKQLLVDLVSQDNAEWAKLSASHTKLSYDDFNENSKISRFTKAFDNFFGNIQFGGIETEEHEIKVNFQKHDRLISLDRLSTGEKQIVFRGATLLRNVNNLNGGIILIDEPELSMHPKWQENILGYYRKLFTFNNLQTTQMIFASHSESILRASLEDFENVLIIILLDNNGTIEAERITAPFVLPTITSAEINYMAFKVPSIDYHIELYGYLQNKTGKTKVKDCDEYIKASTQYNATKHAKASCFTDARGHVINYETLPTFIRNKIDHPQLTSPANEFTRDELLCSIELLVELCKPAVPHP